MRVFFNYLSRSELVLLLVVVLLGIIAIAKTPSSEVSIFDALSYLRLAYNNSPLSLIFKKEFIDVGYPIVLSTLINLFGVENIIWLQYANFVFWGLATILVYRSLVVLIKPKMAFIGSLMMAMSPVYTSFSAKLYSEPLASLGVALLIFAVIKSRKFSSKTVLFAVVLGMLVFFFTKNVYTLLILYVLFLYKAGNLPSKAIIITTVCVVLVRLAISYSGGRADYNLAIQAAKLNQPLKIITICGVYNFSYPVGLTFFGGYESYCWQNTQIKDKPGYNLNAYVVALEMHDRGFDITDWFKLVASNSFKYVYIMVMSMLSLVFIEGYYATYTSVAIGVQLVIFAFVKVVFACYLWTGVYLMFKRLAENSVSYAIMSIVPLLYFFLVVGNFPVEQRYFYPLFPYVYFYAALGMARDSKTVDRLILLFS